MKRWKNNRTTVSRTIILLLLAFIVLASATGVDTYAGLYERDQPWPDELNRGSSMSLLPVDERWGVCKTDYIYADGDKIVTVTGELGEDTIIYIAEYDRNFNLLNTRTLQPELERFGCFYSGETYNYIAYFQTNVDEEDNKEIIRVVKYDKAFNRIGSVSVKGGEAFSVAPFSHSGTMDEHDGTLILHTSRKRYMTDDGLNHQSQLTVVIDSDNMTLSDYYLGKFQKNHVSHSFNQFVRFDGNEWVLVDHGDAYPRSIVLHKWNSSKKSFTVLDLFEIPGETGANCTGIGVGGFEISDESYIVAINSVDHTKITSYGDFAMTGEDVSERDIYVLMTSKNAGSSTKKIKLTNYSGNHKTASLPYLVKVDKDVFAVLWEEYPCMDEEVLNEQKSLRYVYINSKGEMISPISTLNDMSLSFNCDPIVVDGHIVWYVDIRDAWYVTEKDKRIFYDVPTSNDVPETVPNTPSVSE
jgi:hypothetical protein